MEYKGKIQEDKDILDRLEEIDRNEFLKWINEELRINSLYPFKNNDFNKLSGTIITIIYKMDLKESKEKLIKWILEEFSLNPNQINDKKLIKKLSINKNE